MSVTGIKQSPLLDKAIKNDQSNVPIGAPVITHDVHRISTEIKGLITGTPLTEPMARQIGVDGQEGNEVGRDPSKGRLIYQEPQDVNSKRIVEVSFNPKIGCLTLVRANKEEFQIPGFLRLDQLGVGPTGPRGLPGLDARPGKPGRDGRKGATGCAGPEGKPGPMGAAGNAGREGYRGLQGPDGCEGPVGAVGPMGPPGRHGFEGPRGLRGPSCVAVNEDGSTNAGADGPAGATFGDGGVWMGQVAQAPMTVAIVGLPDDGIDAAVVAPAVVPAPPTSAPAPTPPGEPPTPPPPAPVPPAGSVLPSTTFPPVSETCGATRSAFANVYANWSAPNVTRGLAHLPRNGQYVLGDVGSIVMSVQLPRSSSYKFEIYAPAGVAVSLFLNCVIKASIELTGPREATVVEVPAEDITSIRMRYLSNHEGIPVWCAMRILDGQTNAVLYRTGENAVNAGLQNNDSHPNAIYYKIDPNWRSNTIRRTRF